MSTKSILLGIGGTILIGTILYKSSEDYIKNQINLKNEIKNSYNLSKDEFKRLQHNYGTKTPQVKRNWKYYKDSLEKIQKQQKTDSINIMEQVKKAIKNKPQEFQDNIIKTVSNAIKNSRIKAK